MQQGAVTMSEYYERYIDNLEQIQKLMQFRPKEGLSAERMITEIRDNARQRHEICLANDRLLENVLFGREPASLKKEEAQELARFADRLFLQEDSLDTGIAHYIHRLLLEYARKTQDLKLYIRELYQAGITLLHVKPIVLHGQVRNPFRDQITAYFEEGASYLDRYDEIEDEETRDFILRCCEKRDEKEYLYVFPQERRQWWEDPEVDSERKAFEKYVLKGILTYHPPTYVHSKMVAWIGEMLCRRMVAAAPEKLAGTMGLTDAESVRREGETLCRQVYEGGLCHDLGKSRILNYIGLYGRKLLDEEFACVKLHTVLGCSLLRVVGAEPLARIALHHHQWADGKGGYPYPCDPCPEEYRMLVDIVSVADSIDAATDNIGRSYASAKTFGQLVEELREGAGTRYRKDVTELFDDEEFYREMERELIPRRQRIYCQVYGLMRQEYGGGRETGNGSSEWTAAFGEG